MNVNEAPRQLRKAKRVIFLFLFVEILFIINLELVPRVPLALISLTSSNNSLYFLTLRKYKVFSFHCELFIIFNLQGTEIAFVVTVLPTLHQNFKGMKTTQLSSSYSSDPT